MSRPPKTIKEQKFLQEYITNGGNATVAAIKTYDCTTRDSARSLGSQNLAKLNISEYFDKLGFDNLRLIETLIDATQSTKYYCGVEVPDWHTRLKAIEICMKIKGTVEVARLQRLTSGH